MIMWSHIMWSHIMWPHNRFIASVSGASASGASTSGATSALAMPDSQGAAAISELQAKLRGSLRAQVSLASSSWFAAGGAAQWMLIPKDEDDMALARRIWPEELPFTVLGATSNVLVRDGGIAGLVMRLGAGLAGITRTDRGFRVGAGTRCRNLALRAQAEGCQGLEFLLSIPGSIGGAVRMNAGCFGNETAEQLLWIEAVDAQGRKRRLDPRDLDYHYRGCAWPRGWIVSAAGFADRHGPPDQIARRMAEIEKERKRRQPQKVRCGGSTFKNPPGDHAWRLIAQAGGRGLRLGGAQVSTQHANFLINSGHASATDIEALGEEVRRRVRAQSGVILEWEIHRLGDPEDPQGHDDGPEDPQRHEDGPEDPGGAS